LRAETGRQHYAASTATAAANFKATVFQRYLKFQITIEMSIFEQHKPSLAAIIGSHDVFDAFVLDQHICERLSNLTDPRGEKVWQYVYFVVNDTLTV
jgi:hypothetical protein